MLINKCLALVACLALLSSCSAAQQTSTTVTAAKSSISKQTSKTKGDWPMFRGNSQSTGVATSSLPDQLEVIWEFDVPKGAFEGSAAIVEMDGKKVVYIGDLDGKLFSLDFETGEKRWEFEAESGIGFSTSPTFHEGKIYIGDVDGLFYCVNDTGKKVWSFQTNAIISSSANFYKGNVILGSHDANLYCLEGNTGEVIWEFQAEDQIRCTPTIIEGRAFVAGCDGRFHVIDLDKGEEIGSVNIESPTGGTAAVLNDTVYFGTEQAGFFAVRWEQLEIRWHFVDEAVSAIRSNPAVTDGHVIFGAADRVVRSLDPATKKENWATTLKTKIETSPVIVDDRVFVATGDGRLYALELVTGKIVLEMEFEGGFTASPSVGFERLIIASDRGKVYCLGSQPK